MRDDDNLIKREFVLRLSLNDAWELLSKIEKWRTWAPHVKSVEMDPVGDIKVNSTCTIMFNSGLKMSYKITEVNAQKNWKWEASILWYDIFCDHKFMYMDKEHTKISWLVDCEGFGSAIFGFLFSYFHSRKLNVAIPNLIAEVNRSYLKGRKTASQQE